MIMTTLEKGIDFSRQSLEPQSKAQTKRIIFLAAYVFEDIGQVLCQEGFGISIYDFQMNSHKPSNKYIYYEQFSTRKSLFSLVNAFAMILLAIPTVKLVFRYSVINKKRYILILLLCSKTVLSYMKKLKLIFLYALPALMLYVLRFMKGGDQTQISVMI